MHLDILEGLCPINVGQFLLVQADRMPYNHSQGLGHRECCRELSCQSWMVSKIT